MNIGQAADLAGVAAKRIRCYEQIGLIETGSRPERAECSKLNDLQAAAS